MGVMHPRGENHWGKGRWRAGREVKGEQMSPWVWQREASESRLSDLEAKDWGQADSERMDVRQRT